MTDLTEIERLKFHLEEQEQRIDALQVTLSWVLAQLQDQGIADSQRFLSRQANELEKSGNEPLVEELDELAKHVAYLSDQLRN